MIHTWDRRYMALAMFVGEWSKDRSRKVGAVIADADFVIRAIGYNGFPRGVDDAPDTRHARPAKYLWTEHAERNAIYAAARSGVSIAGCTVYVPWFPCMDCARGIVQAGLVRLVAVKPDLTDAIWGDHFVIALELLKEARVAIDWFDSKERQEIPESISAKKPRR